MRAGLTLEHPTPLAPVERGCSARQSRSLERNAEEIRTGFAMLEAFSNDPQRKRLYLRDSCLLALAIRQNARQLQHFGQPAAVHFQSDLPEFPPRLSAIGVLHGLLTHGQNRQPREDLPGHDAEEGPGVDEKAEVALEPSLALMAQPSLDVKGPHRAFILLASR